MSHLITNRHELEVYARKSVDVTTGTANVAWAPADVYTRLVVTDLAISLSGNSDGTVIVYTDDPSDPAGPTADNILFKHVYDNAFGPQFLSEHWRLPHVGSAGHEVRVSDAAGVTVALTLRGYQA